LKKNYGKIDTGVTIQELVALSQTGDMQIAIYDFKQNLIYVANARADGESGEPKAFQRAFIQLDMNKIFAEKL
jgi:hypothetical protein